MSSTKPAKLAGRDRDIFFNRELSWLDFNARVLAEANSTSVPLLERLKFLSIFFSNLDEFFMVRVAGLMRMMEEGILVHESPDDMTPAEILENIQEKVLTLLNSVYSTIYPDIVKQLDGEEIKILQLAELTRSEKKYIEEFYQTQVEPVLTPMSVDPAHPFPYLANLALYYVVRFQGERADENPVIGLLEVPSILPRMIPVSKKNGEYRYVFLEDVIEAHIESVFLGYEINGCYAVRVTRNLDYNLLETEVVDLLKSVQKHVTKKRNQEAVRLEYTDKIPPEIVRFLLEALELTADDAYPCSGPLQLSDLMELFKISRSDLKDPSFNPRIPTRLGRDDSIFESISERDLLVHHPFDSFYTVTEFLNSAARDPNVLAIKQTLYRTSGDSPIIDALIAAAENGKQVAAVIELKARFDEKNNIVWARRLERAGVHVVYGFIGYKTHAKSCLVVRREGDKLVRYAHLSTGNYNSNTATLYTDIGLLTKDPAITSDVSAMFNLLTGFNSEAGSKSLTNSGHVPEFSQIWLAPFSMRENFIRAIDREVQAHKAGKEALIIAKVNSLVDRAIIEKLYKASATGLKIKLIVRGICCLKPGVKGMSENIEVFSLIDRYLEHSRMTYFKSQDLLLLGSADWMVRNMDRRIEIVFPIRDEKIKKRVVEEILEIYLKDNEKMWKLQSTGDYVRVTAGKTDEPCRAQSRFIELVRGSGLKSVPYEKAIRMRKGKRPIAQKSTKKRRS